MQFPALISRSSVISMPGNHAGKLALILFIQFDHYSFDTKPKHLLFSGLNVQEVLDREDHDDSFERRGASTIFGV